MSYLKDAVKLMKAARKIMPRCFYWRKRSSNLAGAWYTEKKRAEKAEVAKLGEALKSFAEDKDRAAFKKVGE